MDQPTNPYFHPSDYSWLNAPRPPVDADASVMDVLLGLIRLIVEAVDAFAGSGTLKGRRRGDQSIVSISDRIMHC